MCTSQVVVMDYIEGYSITNTEQLKRDGIDINDLAKDLSQIFNKMIFDLGFVHADPHPGNIFVQKDS